MQQEPSHSELRNANLPTLLHSQGLVRYMDALGGPKPGKHLNALAEAATELWYCRSLLPFSRLPGAPWVLRLELQNDKFRVVRRSLARADKTQTGLTTLVVLLLLLLLLLLCRCCCCVADVADAVAVVSVVVVVVVAVVIAIRYPSG